MTAAAGSRGARGYAAAGAVAIAAYFAAGGHAGLQAAIYQAVDVGAVVAVLAGVRRNRPRDPRPWLLFAGALALWTAGDTYWNVYVWFLGSTAPFPSPADIAYLAGYPLLALGVLALMRGWGRPRLRDLLDGAVISVAAAIVIWVALVGPLARGTLSSYATTVSVAEPVADVALLLAFTQLVLRGRAASVALRLVTASVAFQLVADFVYGYLNFRGAYANGMPLDAGWLAAYVLWGVAALHPSMGRIQTLPARVDELSRRRIAVLALSLGAPPAVLVVQATLSTPTDALEIAVATLAELALVGARVLLVVRERERIRVSLADSERRFREQLEIAKHAQLELGEQNEQLHEVDRMKDDLIALVSHELRTPLTSIIGYLELITTGEAGELTESQRSMLGIVERNARRLIRVVSDLLLVAQAQSGHLTLVEEELELGDLVEECVAGVRPAATARDIELGLVTTGVTSIVGDRQRLAQVVDNLLSNAVKFTPERGSVSVSVSDSGGRVVLEVADTGIGIPPSEQKQLFTRFFRTAAATAGAVQGTGLGLSIVKAIVDAHGGEISVASRVSRGSMFRVALPAAANVAGRELVSAA